MGDCETAETLPPTDSNKDGEEPTLAPENNVTCGVQLADAKKDEQTSQVEKLDELGEINFSFILKDKSVM